MAWDDKFCFYLALEPTARDTEHSYNTLLYLVFRDSYFD